MDGPLAAPMLERCTPSECPQCGAGGPIRIGYGDPAPEATRKAQLGLVELGGCVLYPDRPDWRCKACGHGWFYADERAALDELVAAARERNRKLPIPPALVPAANDARCRTWDVCMGQKARVSGAAFNQNLREVAISLLRGTAFEFPGPGLSLEIAASIRHPRNYLLSVTRAGHLEGWDESADSVALQALQRLAGPVAMLENVDLVEWSSWPLEGRTLPEAGG